MIKFILFVYFCIDSTVALSGTNICKKRRHGQEVVECCYGFYQVQQFCIPCPIGTFGPNCSSLCPPGYYGKLCENTCNCKGDKVCHPTDGCITADGNYVTQSQNTVLPPLEDQAIQLQNNSTNNTTSLCQCERYRFHFTFAEFIILGTLLLLIVLALANIFVSKTHIMEVKHDTNLVMGTNYNHNVHGQTQRSGGNQRRNGTATTTLTHTTEGDQKKKKSKPTGKATNKSHKTGDGQVTRVAKSRSGDYESDDGWSDFEDEEEDYGRTEVDNDNLYILCNGASNQEYFTFGDL